MVKNPRVYKKKIKVFEFRQKNFGKKSIRSKRYNFISEFVFHLICTL